ncbi:hypothetical protein DFR58_10554 [Anaerobacterium chartisolvens]|uniref:Uncharacterized protein n=1 Tax=Anaerobacterium chartisolvens TaxID=1297424 RepID=A0A369BAE9_9FIRM|nr:hypothetical protein DFR58_10554 [Anaerobacterium chartisolvens]
MFRLLKNDLKLAVILILRFLIYRYNILVLREYLRYKDNYGNKFDRHFFLQ